MNIGTKITLKERLSDGSKQHGKILGVQLYQKLWVLQTFDSNSFFRTFDGKKYFVGYFNPFTNRMYTDWFLEDKIEKYNK